MRNRTDADDDLHTALSEQRRQLMAAETLDSDLDMAFNLQMQEAMTASLALNPSTSHSPPRLPPPLSLSTLWPKLYGSLSSSSSKAVVVETECLRLYCKGIVREEMVRRDMMVVVGGAGVAICDPRDNLIVEARKYLDAVVDGVVLSKEAAELEALIEGLHRALNLDLKAVTFFCDDYNIYHYVTNRVVPGNRKIATLVNQVTLLQRKFEHCSPSLVAHSDIKFAFEFARDAIVSQIITWPAETAETNGRWPGKQRKIATLVNQVKSLQSKFTKRNLRLVPRYDIKFAFKLARDAILSQSQTKKPAQSITCKPVIETCVICLEDTDVSQMFSVDGCLHQYCFSCMKRHVEEKLLHVNVMVPRCPHEGCKSKLSVDSCAKFLTPKHVETMCQRIKEASIPATERVYCPYPRCSALMTKSELLKHANETLRSVEVVRRCMKCHFLFCINCKVPWHINMTCSDYKRLNPYPQEEDTKLKFLASSKLWRQCVKCNHMIELAEGCFHMTCRCGYEFCYKCGAGWKDKRPTCSCPLFDDVREEVEVQEETYIWRPIYSLMQRWLGGFVANLWTS